MTGYAIMIEGGDGSYSAYAPELASCVSTGRTIDEVERNMREAIEFHLDSMCEDGDEIPEPTTVATGIAEIVMTK